MINQESTRSKFKWIIAALLAPLAAELLSRAAKAGAGAVSDAFRYGVRRARSMSGYNDPAELSLIDTSRPFGTVSKSYEKWVTQYSKEGITIPSLADYYCAGRSGSDGSLHAIRKDLETYLVHTSTSLNPGTSTLDTRVSHHTGLATHLDDTISMEIPKLTNKPLVILLDEPTGVTFMQAILYTTDNRTEIIDGLSRFADVLPENIRVTTPKIAEPESLREDCQPNSISLCYGNRDGNKTLYILADITNEPGMVHTLAARR